MDEWKVGRVDDWMAGSSRPIQLSNHPTIQPSNLPANQGGTLVTLPILHLSGTPYEQGLQHGQALSERIAHSVAVSFQRFQREGRLSRDEALAMAARYGEAIATQSPAYFAGV